LFCLYTNTLSSPFAIAVVAVAVTDVVAAVKDIVNYSIANPKQINGQLKRNDKSSI
jgi:hypothetical protein